MTNYDDDSEPDDESDAVDNDKELFLEEQFLLAELAIMDADNGTPKSKISCNTASDAIVKDNPCTLANSVNPVVDNPNTPANSANPVVDNPKSPASGVNPDADNPNTPKNSVNPVVNSPRLLQETGIIVSAEEARTFPSIMNSKPSYVSVDCALFDVEVSKRDQDPLLDPKNTARAKEMVQDKVEEHEESKCIQCMDDTLPTGTPNFVIPNI